MSELSVNDHLEGILSDFEALKRSFDIDDEEDIPAFSSPSPTCSPRPPASPHFYLNRSKAAAAHPSSTRSYSTSSAYPPPHLSPPTDRPRAVVTSLSFSKGSTATGSRAHQNNGSSCVTRAASFQSRFSPNGFSTMFGAGSDNDSLHSSTSSLEYSAGGPRLLSHPSPRSPDEYPPSLQQRLDSNFNQRKFSPVSEPRDISSRPLQDPHSPNGDRGGAVGRSGAGGRHSPGFKFANANVIANANWNGRFQNASSFGEEHHAFNNHSPKPAAATGQRKPPQLHKFPLDLDNIVTAPVQDTSPREPVPPRSPGSSASLSSLDSSDTPPGPQRVPRVSPCPVPLSPAQTPRLEVLSGPLVGQLQGSWAGGADELVDSVGSILQRIASFSQPALHHTSTNGTAPPLGATGHRKESAGDLERDVPMEDTEVLPPTTPITTTHAPTTNGSSEMRQEDSGQAQDECTEVTRSNGAPQDDSTQEHPPEHPQEQPPEHPQGHPPEHSHEHLPEHQHEHLPERLHAEAQDSSRQNGETLENGEHTEHTEGPQCPPFPDPGMSYLSGADLFGYVGIEAVLDQMRRKTMRAGFEFNVMVVGQSGLGKSTLVNTLFKSRVSRKSCSGVHQEKIPKTVRIHQVSHMIEEKGVKMKLTVVDTPGFGDHINNNNCWEPIVSYVNEQYERYLREELNVTRKPRIPDTRVHCCVYFLPPTGHRLRSIDVEFMKHLGSIVSIVPVIAKADTLTLDERLDFKHRIRQDLAANGIQVYPQKQYDEDPEERLLNSSIRECIPFAVVGTDREHQVNGHKVLGRKTKWGIIEVENIGHCEFSHLRDLLIRSHLQDLKDVTHNVLYETYRVRRLNQANVDFSQLDSPLFTPDRCDPESQL